MRLPDLSGQPQISFYSLLKVRLQFPQQNLFRNGAYLFIYHLAPLKKQDCRNITDAVFAGNKHLNLLPHDSIPPKNKTINHIKLQTVVRIKVGMK